MRWVEVDGPERVAPGKSLRVLARARNGGATVWENTGENRTEVTAMVVDGTGNPWTEQAGPGFFAYPVPPQGAGTAEIYIPAPTIPGRYTVLLGITRRAAGKTTPDSAPPARLEFQVIAPGGGGTTSP